MKSIFTFLILGAFIAILTGSYQQKKENRFYYAYDEKITLSEVDNKLILQYKSNQRTENKVLLSVLPDISEQNLVWRNDSTLVIEVHPSTRSQIKSEIEKQEDILVCNPVYKTLEGIEMGFTDRFIFKLKEGVSITALNKMNSEYKVEIINTTDHYFILRVQPDDDALEISNKYFESGVAEYSHPDFFADIVFHQATNDPYFNNQFYLHNTGQVFTDGHFGIADADIDAPEAWTVTTGSSNIIVAVLDQGVTSNHVELPNTRQVRLNGSNFADGNANDPSPTGDMNHGNACAGIIGATRNNNVGVAGIVPGVRIMPIRISNSNGSGISASQVAAAIDFAYTNGAHILSNSWAYNSNNPNFLPAVRDAISRATTLGRGGLGSVVAFAAGNNAHHAIGAPGQVLFPANVNIAGVLTIGASERDDLQANYSPMGNPGAG